MFCTNCGKIVPNHMRFCSNCGAQMNGPANGPMGNPMNRPANGPAYGPMGNPMNGPANGPAYGPMGNPMNGPVNGMTNRPIANNTENDVDTTAPFGKPDSNQNQAGGMIPPTPPTPPTPPVPPVSPVPSPRRDFSPSNDAEPGEKKNVFVIVALTLFIILAIGVLVFMLLVATGNEAATGLLNNIGSGRNSVKETEDEDDEEDDDASVDKKKKDKEDKNDKDNENSDNSDTSGESDEDSKDNEEDNDSAKEPGKVYDYMLDEYKDGHYGRSDRESVLDFRAPQPIDGLDTSNGIPVQYFDPSIHEYELFFTDDMTFAEATEECRMKGGHLVTVVCAEEADLIKRLLDKNGVSIDNTYIWMGITFDNDGVPYFVTGENPGISYWAPGRPSGQKGFNYCAMTFNKDTNSWLWMDEPNKMDGLEKGAKVAYLCEWEIITDKNYYEDLKTR